MTKFQLMNMLFADDAAFNAITDLNGVTYQGVVTGITREGGRNLYCVTLIIDDNYAPKMVCVRTID